MTTLLIIIKYIVGLCFIYFGGTLHMDREHYIAHPFKKACVGVLLFTAFIMLVKATGGF